MLDETIFKVNHVGKDGFIWWIGQVAKAEVWKGKSNIANYSKSDVASKNWPERCKVRIIGYHTFRKGELSDEDLPWAHIMIDPAFGSGQGGEGTTSNLTGGEVCFGFFLDGDDAQQPVVVGLLHRSREVQSFPEDESFAFRPFTGHSGNIPSTKAKATSPTAPKEAPPPPGSSAQTSTTPTPTAPTTTPTTPTTTTPTTNSNSFTYSEGFWKTPAGIGVSEAFNLDLKLNYNFPSMNGDTLWTGKENLANAAFQQNMTYSFITPSTCNDNFIGQITQILQDFIGFTNGLQKFADTYINPVLNKVVDIGSQIKSVAYSIGGVIRFITNSFRGTIIKCITSLFKKFILTNSVANPISNILQTIIGQSAKKIINIIFCLFEKLIPIILNLIEKLLTDLVDSVFAASLCAIEQWVAEILAKTMTALDEILDPIISGVSWLTGGLGSVFEVLNNASSFASLIYSFIGCDNLKCTTPSKWVSNIGPSQTEADNWSRMVNNVGFVNSINDNLALVQGEMSKINALTSTNYPLDCSGINNPITQDDLPTSYGNVILPQCIPPEISVFGDGSGAYLIPFVNETGSIISAKIVAGGSDYTRPPLLTIIDKSGYGKDAVLSCKINKEGAINKIIVINGGSGYCPANLDDPNIGIDSENEDLEDLDKGECINDIEPIDVDEENDEISRPGKSKYKLFLKASKKKVFGGESFTITIKSSRLTKPKRVSYSINGVEKNDIEQKLNGILDLNAGSAEFVIDTNPKGSLEYKSSKIFTFTLDDYNGPNRSVSVLIVDKKEKDLTSTYTLSSNKDSINEGAKFKITLKTKNIEDNTLVPFKIITENNSLIDNFNSYSNFRVLQNKAEITFNTVKNLIQNDQIIRLELLNGEAFISILVNKISKGSETNIVRTVCIEGLEVVRPGIGYQIGDYATDGVNKFELIISPNNGAIFKSKELPIPICGYTDLPQITVNTLTGNGAEIYPIMKVNESPSSNINMNNITGISSDTISVVDCI